MASRARMISVHLCNCPPEYNQNTDLILYIKQLIQTTWWIIGVLWHFSRKMRLKYRDNLWAEFDWGGQILFVCQTDWCLCNTHAAWSVEMSEWDSQPGRLFFWMTCTHAYVYEGEQAMGHAGLFLYASSRSLLVEKRLKRERDATLLHRGYY